MKSKIEYYIVLVVCVLSFVGSVKGKGNEDQIFHLYTDKSYCLSGDTLRFKVWLPQEVEKSSNVVRLQLSSSTGNVVATVACKSHQQWAEGYIHLPDSLSSGVYYVLAFLNENRNLIKQRIKARPLQLYNRFHSEISEIDVPKKNQPKRTHSNHKSVDFKLDKETYSTREKIEGTLKIETELFHAVISARLIDPLSESNPEEVWLDVENNNKSIVDFKEKDGILLSGKVTTMDSIPEKNALVVLSISTEPPYFDYCISDDAGGFNFFLPNAMGTAAPVLQAISKSNKELLVRHELNALKLVRAVDVGTKQLNHEQKEFIHQLIQANFFNKLFGRTRLLENDWFEMPPPFEMPFYGKTSKRIVPNEFINLPDFKEISRELINGVQYRTKKERHTLRLLNADEKEFFDREPLRLLNGVPIFKNNLFSNFGSADINYIDVVEQERVYGDLFFSGVFAISLHDKSNLWLAQQTNIAQYNFKCLQPTKPVSYNSKPFIGVNEPDIRQNYLWKIIYEECNPSFSFYLSDLKGRVEISIEGLSKENEWFKTSKIIEVK